MARYRAAARRAGRLALDLVLPHRCLACEATVTGAAALCGGCFAQAQFLTEPMCRRCGLPFEFDPGAASDRLATQCASCAAWPPPFARARAVMVYDDLARRLVVGFKHRDRTHAAPTFGAWLARAGAELVADCDLATPAPLHRLRLFTRRYNQSALLAQALARHTSLTFAPDLLRRTRATPPQADLSAAQRARNVRRAFAVRPRRRHLVEGARVLLIDDVMTTGATARECADALLRAGADAVDVLTLARVDRPAPSL